MTKSKLEHALTQLLDADEKVLVVTTVQVKGGVKKELAATTLASVAAGVAMSALGQGLLVAFVPPACWFVGTDRRVLLVERTNNGRDLGAVVMSAPRQALTATLKTRLLSEVTLADAGDGASIARLNVGVKRGAATGIVEAVNG